MAMRIEPEAFKEIVEEIGMDLTTLINTPLDHVDEKYVKETLEKQNELFFIFIDYGDDFNLQFATGTDEKMQQYSEQLNVGYNFDEGPTLCYVNFEDMLRTFAH